MGSHGAAARRIADRFKLTQERIYLETARVAFFDVRKLFHDDGRPKSIRELDDDVAAGLVSIEVFDEFEGRGAQRRKVGVVRRYRLADKNSALERAARLLGLFRIDNSQRSDPILSLLGDMKRSAFPLAAASVDE